MKITCISDLHGHYPELEGGDLLIIAGDLTARDESYEYLQVISWLNEQKYEKIVLIAGNHDNKIFDKEVVFDPNARITYLCDLATEFEGLKIYGSPWTKTFPGMNPHCKAFTVDSEEELAEKWKLIPQDTDILITHSPPYGILDECPKGDKIEMVGSDSLRKLIFYDVLKPKLHVFGHVHEGYGKITRISRRVVQCELREVESFFVNASHVDEYYRPDNKPINIILD